MAAEADDQPRASWPIIGGADRARSGDVPRPQPPGDRLGDVDDRAVGRQADAVRRPEVVSDLDDVRAVGAGEVQTTEVVARRPLPVSVNHMFPCASKTTSFGPRSMMPLHSE